MVKKKKLGVGAKCNIANKYLHPGKTIADRYPNQTAQSRLDNAVCYKMGLMKIRKKEVEVAFFRHGDFENVQIYCVPRWARIVEEGSAIDFFDKDDRDGDDDVEVNVNNVEPIVEVPNEVSRAQNCGEDIAMVRAMGFMVEDDNDPAPENIPEPGGSVTDGVTQTWGWSGADQRSLFGATDHQPKMKTVRGILLETITYPAMFLLLFPRLFLEDVILLATNSNLTKKMDLSEFLVFIGLWFILSYASPGNLNRAEFWSLKAPNREGGAPFRLNDLMSGRRFEEIIGALAFTDLEPPSFKDKFWEIRQMVKAWNDNMCAVFSAGWITCLDESMSIWTNKWTCPGYVFCPRKPHPFGNEWHTISCGICGILFAMELVEGKDRPSELPAPPKNKKTIHLLLRLCKSLYGTGKIVILDSGFCVLQGIIKLRKLGVFAGALIKKRRYWPKHIPGDKINDHFKDKEV